MLPMKIFFAVLIIVCAVFYVMYLWDFALVLLIAVTAIPVISFVSLFITKKLINVEFAAGTNSASKKENFTVQLMVENKSFFPVGKAEAHISYSNVLSRDVSSFDLHMPIQARNVQKAAFQMSSRFCGIVDICCDYILIYDPLKIFSFKVCRNISAQVAVMPEGHEISGEVSYTDRVNEESNVFSEFKPGDDPSEVFDLRGYHPGDKLNRIHWKLSSKKDEFIVKDYSLPVDTPCMVFLNLKSYEKEISRFTLPIFDTLIESFVSVSQFLLQNERVHSVVFYSAKRKDFTERIISEPDDLAAAVQELIFSVKENAVCQPPEAYFAEKGALSLASFTFITAVPDTQIIEYISDNVDADIKNALIAVKSEEKAAALTSFADISVIPVVIGRITSSIKDIEL